MDLEHMLILPVCVILIFAFFRGDMCDIMNGHKLVRQLRENNYRYVDNITSSDTFDFFVKYLKSLTTTNKNRTGLSSDIQAAIDILKKRWEAKNDSTILFSDLLREIVPKSRQSTYQEYRTHSTIDKKPIQNVIDIIIPINELSMDFDEWRQVLEGFHVILLYYGVPNLTPKLPDWLDYELFTSDNIITSLGEKSWIISTKDANIRSFGYLISEKTYVFTFDPTSRPVKGEDGRIINPINWHIENLISSALPDYYNTISDPITTGLDFVRGYPYSLRNGVSTGISHGLWQPNIDYDSPTQLLRRISSNQRRSAAEVRNKPIANDLAQTVPRSVLFSLSTQNLAFNRDLIGVLFLPFATAEIHPFAGMEDIFTGWVAKIICSHVGIGTKTGSSYLFDSDNQTNLSSSSSYTDKQLFERLKKEITALQLQESFFKFVQNIKINLKSTVDRKNILLVYRHIAHEIADGLKQVHPYFRRFGEAMLVWADLWESRNVYGESCVGRPCPPKWWPIVSQSSIGPTSYSNNKESSACAVFTVTRDENVFLPVWIRYYLRHIPPQDIWILDHRSQDNSTNANTLPKGVHIKVLYGEDAFSPHYFIARQIELHQQQLLRVGYKCVLFTEIDEIVAPDPAVYRGGLREYLHIFLNSSRVSIRTFGYELLHKTKANNGSKIESPMDWSKDVLSQRHFWVPNSGYNKPILSKVPIHYSPGFHQNIEPPKIQIDSHLRLIHLHSADYNTCYQRGFAKFNKSNTMIPQEKKLRMSSHVFEFDIRVKRNEICYIKNGVLKGNLSARHFYDDLNIGNVSSISLLWKTVSI